jgi:hypothetical protein
VKIVRLRKLKATCSPLYADNRSKTNAAILWDMGHTKGKLCTGNKGKKPKT